MATHSSILAWKILQTDHEVSNSDTTERLTFSLSAPLMLLKLLLLLLSRFSHVHLCWTLDCSLPGSSMGFSR